MCIRDSSYSVYPHANDWRSADTVHKGYEFNYESAAKQALKHEGALASNHSFASVSYTHLAWTGTTYGTAFVV